MEFDHLTFTLTEIGGRPHWLFSDGTVLPVIRGGADEGGAGSGDPGASGNGGGGEGAPGGGDGGGAGAGGRGDPGSGAAGDGWKPPASKAELDDLISQGVTERFDQEFGRRKTKWEQDVKQYLEAEGKKQGMEGDAKELVAAAERKADERMTAADQRIVRTEAKVAAITAGAKPDRVAALMRLTDLSKVEVGADGEPNAEQLKTAVAKALTENPEFKAGASNGAGGGSSGGEFNGSGDKKVWTRAEIAKMSPEEYEKHEDEILAQLQAGGIK